MINFKVIRTHPLGFFFILLILIISGFLHFTDVYFLRRAFNKLEEGGASNYWLFFLLILLFFCSRSLTLILSTLLSVLIDTWLLRARRNISTDIIQQLSKSRLRYFNSLHREGKILSSIRNDLGNYVNIKINLISMYILNVSTFLGVSGFLIYNNWIFGLTIVLGFLLIQLTPKNFKQKLKTINTDQSLANKDYIASFSEALDNHLPLRLLRSAKLLKKHMFSSSKNEINTVYRQDRFSTLVSNMSEMIFFTAERGAILAVISLYSLGYFKGHLRLGDVLSLPQVIIALRSALSFLMRVKLYQESAKNYLKILKDQIKEILTHSENESTQSIKPSPKTHNPLSKTPSISIENLSFNYENQKVFERLNLKFNPGLSYGIEGASGIGKSTLISLILGQQINYRGSIKIGNQEVRELGEESIFKLVKLVDSSNFVFDATIEENVTLFDESLDPIPSLKKAALLEEFETLALQKIGASNLSEGQKQRVNFARLFQHLGEAKILILDEALSNLDKVSREKVKESFDQLKQQGYTLIFISHHIDKNDVFYDQLINLEKEIKKTKE